MIFLWYLPYNLFELQFDFLIFLNISSDIFFSWTIENDATNITNAMVTQSHLTFAKLTIACLYRDYLTIPQSTNNPLRLSTRLARSR